MERYVCIHGHFYQPPRENPWIETIELQDAAYPYHDWNERITAECYEPNTASRILDDEGCITSIVNNYSKMSFNFGPTLLAWLEGLAPSCYQAILDADWESQKTFSGHGSALAQAYNHLIMPLANRRDKYTQVLWGIKDFEHRFRRNPEGMWLPETAVDLETLEIMAKVGLRFTILAQHQAKAVREIGSTEWQDVTSGRIDPTMPYELRLPSGRKINLFFYNGPTSRAVAFEGLLSDGGRFANRLIDTFADGRDQSQLVHIATDGETYGHHQRYGDMALAYAIHYIESSGLARLTNYGEYLEKHPPTYQVEIYENTSWSCGHGVERWRSDCGDNSGGHPGWSQAWRAPLREALDSLRDTLAPKYEEKSKEFIKKPWAARDDCIDIILDRSTDSIDRFIAKHAHRKLKEAEKVTLLKLLEIQRHSMLMYTSCGWFFDELSGIETVQVIQYAGRAVQLAQEIFGDDIEGHFIERLAQARSNIPEHRDGALIYERFVKPTRLNLERVVAHYAVSSIFNEYSDTDKVFCYTVDRQDYEIVQAGRSRAAVGRVRITSNITRESAVVSFGLLHFGDHNLNGGVREFRGEAPYQALKREMTEAFKTMDFSEIIRLLDDHFGKSTYSLRSLFRDEQRKVINLIMEPAMKVAYEDYDRIYYDNLLLMRFVASLGVPLPKTFHSAAETVVNNRLAEALASDDLEQDLIKALLEEAGIWRINLDFAGLGFTFGKTLERMAEQTLINPVDYEFLQKFDSAADTLRVLPFEVRLWKVQNLYYNLLHTVLPELLQHINGSSEDDRALANLFISLGDKLRVATALPYPVKP